MAPDGLGDHPHVLQLDLKPNCDEDSPVGTVAAGEDRWSGAPELAVADWRRTIKIIVGKSILTLIS